MSQLITSRFFKPSLCRNFLKHTSIGHARLLSSTTHTSNLSDHDETKTPTTWFYFSSGYPSAHPFLLIDHILNKDNGIIKDKRLKGMVCNSMTSGFLRNRLEIDHYSFSGLIRIDYSPSNPKLKELNVVLPLLPTGTLQSMAMSSLPIRDKDWVVGLKLSGSRVSFCRPYGSSQWVEVKTTRPQTIDPFSSLMFSKKDQKFYVPTLGGNYLCSLDPYSKEEKDQLEFIGLEFDDLPNSVVNELADVSSCSKTDHLVESPTGQLFLVKWYGDEAKDDHDNDDDEDYDDDDDDGNGMKTLKHKVKKFMVFRAEESSWYKPRKTMIYTEDIGDLCIFLGHSEAFCVPASTSPGLKRNCIYFVGYNFGVYDLTTKTCNVFHNEDGVLLSRSSFPYWPPPVPLN